MTASIHALRAGRLLSRLRSIAILAVEAQSEPRNYDRIGDHLTDIDDDIRAAFALLDKLRDATPRGDDE